MTENVLFIIPDNLQEDNHFNSGIGYLAAVLRAAGADVSVYCMDVYHYSNDDLAKYLDDNTFSMIGTGFLCARYVETIKPLLDTIGKHKKDALVVIGGHCPSAVPEYMFEQNPGVDVVCIGEAEKTILYLWNSKQLSTIKGISYREDGKIVTNERRQPIKDLDSIPFPAYDLFPMDIYTTCLKFHAMRNSDKAFGILTSRGCTWNKCSFCHRLEKGFRLRSIKNIVDEIKLLNKKYGITYFNLQDECFLLSMKRLSEFQTELEHNDLKIRFETNARVDQINEENINLLKSLGCSFLNIGFESMNQEVLNNLNKGATVEQNKRAAKIIKKEGISMGLNFIWGCRGDTIESLKANVNFIKRHQDYSQMRTIRFLTPYPGCPDYYRAIKEDLLLGPDDFFKRFKNSDLITIHFTEMDTKELYKALYNANHELIRDYHRHAPEKLPEEEMNNLIDAFHDLYFLGKTDFRGARHYSAKDK